MPHQPIRDWLSQVEQSDIADAETWAEKHGQSRKRRYSEPPVTWDETLFMADQRQTPTRAAKRTRTGDDVADEDEADIDVTPRGNPALERLSRSSGRNQSASSPSGQSSPSRNSSTRRQIASLLLSRNAPIIRELNTNEPDLPAPLSQLVKDLTKTFRVAPQIISESAKESIALAAARNGPDTTRDWYQDPVYGNQDRDILGPTPHIDDVLNLASEAGYCALSQQSEHGWNCVVHYPLLSMAIYGFPNRARRIATNSAFSVCPCNTASILQEYHAVPTPKKMVDFCLLLEPTTDTEREAIRHCRTTLPGLSINHSEEAPLLEKPIGISIETKRTDPIDGAKADLQLVTWQASQWELLVWQMRKNNLEGSSEPWPFLPGIKVIGHDWFLVATSRSGSTTTFWTELPIGSTRDTFDIYKVVYSLQFIMRYTRETYWPWYRRNILGLNSEEG